MSKHKPTRIERFIYSKCDRCGKTTKPKQNEIGDLFTLPHEWAAPAADQGSFCLKCATGFSEENWLQWFREKEKKEGGLGK